VSASEVEVRCKRHSHSCSWVEVDLESGENSRAAQLMLSRHMMESRDRHVPLFERSGTFPLFAAMRRQVKRTRQLTRAGSMLVPEDNAKNNISTAQESFLFHIGSLCSEVIRSLNLCYFVRSCLYFWF
jgi:hypothetical protein